MGGEGMSAAVTVTRQLNDDMLVFRRQQAIRWHRRADHAAGALRTGVDWQWVEVGNMAVLFGREA